MTTTFMHFLTRTILQWLTSTWLTWTPYFLEFCFCICIFCIFLQLVAWAMIFQMVLDPLDPWVGILQMCHFSSARWTAVFCLKNAGVHVSRGIPTGMNRRHILCSVCDLNCVSFYFFVFFVFLDFFLFSSLALWLLWLYHALPIYLSI